MAKTSESKSESADRLVNDWFLTAIVHDGPVASCLDAVIAELDSRRMFVDTIRKSLSGETLQVDAVTDLSQRIRALENTLRFRLPMLTVERPSAWFRAPAATTTGPFQAALLSEPVFAPYDGALVSQVEQALVKSWQMRDASSLPFAEDQPCLWTTLLRHNARLEQICKLPVPFVGLRLDELPDGLPTELQCRSVCSFLTNVRGELIAARERLSNCYQQLRECSLRLWLVQRREAMEQDVRRQRSQRGAQDIRDEFRRRRSQASTAAPLLAPADLEALRFMGFAALPAPGDLRQRYIAMAKKLHPDLQGGDDQGFKLLVNAYNRLTARVEA
ncbi:MAG: J domain-containing protein [Deltaproteobacteria bacterium]|nr:J domain-containing protein [Deltaproteobacteria bacterium]